MRIAISLMFVLSAGHFVLGGAVGGPKDLERSVPQGGTSSTVIRFKGGEKGTVTITSPCPAFGVQIFDGDENSILDQEADLPMSGTDSSVAAEFTPSKAMDYTIRIFNKSNDGYSKCAPAKLRLVTN